jgi:catechol 2,3-dioxygenase-like lactoylglutathione lyase family enzyme
MLKLQHCSLVVSDLARSKAFYRHFLGMTEIPRSPTFTFAGAWFTSEGREIHMIQAKDTTAPAGFADPGRGEKTGLATHFAFEVDNLAVMEARAKEMDVPIVGGPLPRGDGVYQMYLHDPDRYLIELFQWVDDGTGAAERGAVSG